MSPTLSAILQVIFLRLLSVAFDIIRWHKKCSAKISVGESEMEQGGAGGFLAGRLLIDGTAIISS